jgi:hypothetical protein
MQLPSRMLAGSSVARGIVRPWQPAKPKLTQETGTRVWMANLVGCRWKLLSRRAARTNWGASKPVPTRRMSIRMEHCVVASVNDVTADRTTTDPRRCPMALALPG